MNELYKSLLSSQSTVDKSALVQLATADDSTELVADLMSRDIPTQLRAFMLMTAKSELVRVIQLTDALNKLEDTYIQRALADKDGMDMKSLTNAINTITASLNRSMDIIDRVTNDTNLKIMIDQSTKIYNQGNGSQTNVLLTDRNSRERLRNLATQIFSALSTNPSDIVNSQQIAQDEQEPLVVEVKEVSENG